MLTQDYRDRPDNDWCQGTLASTCCNVFYASVLNVILQRRMLLYRLRQTGESTTLLPSATHIDIAAAMASWILADHSR